MPFVSIVVPVKNEAAYVEQCLEGILAQSYPGNRFEIIVVDNGSSDDTLRIVERYCHLSNFQLLINEGDTIAIVRNWGAKKAQGSVLAFLDGDCIPHANWLQVGVELLHSNERVGCVGFVAAEPGPNDTWVEKSWYHVSSTSKYTGTTPVDWLASFNLILWRRIFEEVGGFNETLITCEDAELGYRIGAKYGVLISDASKVRHLGESKTLREFFEREFWRGKGNLKGFFVSANKKRDFRSVFVPVVYALLLCLSLAFTPYSLIAGKMAWYWVVTLDIFVFASPPLFLLLVKVTRSLSIREWLQVMTLLCVYLLARGLSLLQVRSRREG